MNRPRAPRATALLALGTTGLVLAGGLLAAPAASAADGSAFDMHATASSWSAAASRLGTAGSLWEPARTAGLRRTRPIDVVADNLAFTAGAATAGDTYAGTRYGTARRNVWVSEKWADTGWAAEPAYTTSTAKVGTVRIPLGSPGTRIRVTATVLADCFAQPTDANPRPIPAGFRCQRSDVLRTGGYLVMTARPASQMTAPGTTSIVLRSTGLSYAQLVAIASSLQQVVGTIDQGAGSAQMLGMCRQMVSGSMSPDMASAFAQGNGYTTRTGSIDGQPLPVTADFRADRFTLDIVTGAVTGCTYG
jgi:hypothetical protein